MTNDDDSFFDRNEKWKNKLLIFSHFFYYLLPFFLQINLRLILVSGKTKEFLFSPSDSAGDIAQTVFDQWPEGTVSNININMINSIIRKKKK